MTIGKNSGSSVLTSYQVNLPRFSGPFELLLSLIQRKELPLTEVSLSEITEQYLKYLETLETIEPGTIADFVVVAARLLYLKSKLLALGGEPEEDGEEDDLVRDLTLYKAYRSMVGWIRRRYRQGPWQVYRRGNEEVFFYPAPEVTKEALLEYIEGVVLPLRAMMEQARFTFVPEMNVAARVKEIIALIKERIELRFRELTGTRPTRIGQIVNLLGILELARQKVIEVEQKQLFEEILIKKSK
ncbi:MAG: segregation/condensation protein A [Parcubacteria group bacterium]|nr:segregation/condensation protein A [Parcubacteria group bacterium]